MQTQNSGSVASSIVWEEVTDTSVNTSSGSNTIATVESASSSGLNFPFNFAKPLIDVNYVNPISHNRPSTYNEADAK